MSRPIIGITSNFDPEEENFWFKRNYANSIWEVGGIPFSIPHMSGLIDSSDRILNSIDGLLLSGGSDIDPNLFGQEPKFELKQIDPVRDRLELELAEAAIEREFPVLAICRGIQIINVAAGGSLYQDISQQKEQALSHEQDAPRWHPTHVVKVYEDSILRNTIGRDKIKVNSLHHMNVKDIGKGFKVAARSNDGLVEAIENERAPFQLGVQWHPEAMVGNDESSRLLFSRFVEASS